MQNFKVAFGPTERIFTNEEERELLYFKEIEGRLLGLPTSELQTLAGW